MRRRRVAGYALREYLFGVFDRKCVYLSLILTMWCLFIRSGGRMELIDSQI